MGFHMKAQSLMSRSKPEKSRLDLDLVPHMCDRDIPDFGLLLSESRIWSLTIQELNGQSRRIEFPIGCGDFECCLPAARWIYDNLHNNLPRSDRGKDHPYMIIARNSLKVPIGSYSYSLTCTGYSEIFEAVRGKQTQQLWFNGLSEIQEGELENDANFMEWRNKIIEAKMVQYDGD